MGRNEVEDNEESTGNSPCLPSCERTLEPDGPEEKPMGSGTPGTLALAPGGERSCETQVGTFESGEDIAIADVDAKRLD
ncbi:hypothetical protein VCV18_000577 [Metarhizium anisopliae]